MALTLPGTGALVLPSGSSLAAAPAQFDASAALAPMSAVQRALGNLQGATLYGVGAATVLTAAQVGSLIVAQGGTITVPLASSVPDGSTFRFVNAGTGTINCSGTDKFQFDGNGSHSAASIAIASGTTLSITKYGGASATWFVDGGSGQLFNSPEFANLPAQSGYQKLPSGIILQWTTLVTSAAGDVTATFPIAFAATPYTTVGSTYNGTAAQNYTIGFGVPTTTGVSVAAFNPSTGARVAAAVYVQAIGK